jgi:hypothetical protein
MLEIMKILEVCLIKCFTFFHLTDLSLATEAGRLAGSALEL